MQLSRRFIIVVLAMALLAFGTLTTKSEPQTYLGPTVPTPSKFFGMHIHRAAAGTPWPSVPFGTWRLWDAGVAWPQLEPESGRWNFQLLDRYVALADQQGTDILLTLGLTPTWASSHPSESSAYAPGNAAEPRDLQEWSEYVRTVATRYKGRIHTYEIWNEPNVKGTFTGRQSAMLDLARTAYETLKSIDPTITVVSPAATSDDGVPWLGAFLAAGGCDYSDVIGYHFYVTPRPPEAMIGLIHKVQVVLRKTGCTKPLWNTESGWAKPAQFSSEQQAAGYVMRTYLLNRLAGVDRCYWYAWDNRNWSTLDMTSRSSGEVTPAGTAYGVVSHWLLGSILRSCTRQSSGLWICSLERNNVQMHVLWSDASSRSMSIPSNWHARRLQLWTGGIVSAPRVITVGPAPLLLSSN